MAEPNCKALSIKGFVICNINSKWTKVVNFSYNAEHVILNKTCNTNGVSYLTVTKTI